MKFLSKICQAKVQDLLTNISKMNNKILFNLHNFHKQKSLLLHNSNIFKIHNKMMKIYKKQLEL